MNTSSQAETKFIWQKRATGRICFHAERNGERNTET